ncbi:PAS domain S-box protein [Roseimaritima sediminicola]|uniref:PAS domain S-box protein n=1 Tax=Roseimaritima sediminicola TaxID=2662066 RepID=UPI0012984DB0|nr:PAS domain S-box protein [Roseimaritima sediminicola]
MRRPPAFIAYGIAIVVTVLAMVWRWLFATPLGDQVPFVTFFFSVVLAAWLGGAGSALLATFLSAALASYLFLPPHGAILPGDAGGWAALGLFVSFGTATAAISRRIRRDNERLGRERERFSITLASIGDAVITTDTQSRVTYLNPVAQELTGWSQQDAAGKHLAEVFQIFHETSGAPVENPVERVLAHGRIVGLANHTILRARGGGESPIDDSAAPIRDDQGHIVGVVLVFRDVSEQKRADRRIAERESQYRSIVESTSDAILIFDDQARLIEVNPAGCQMHGYTREEMIGMKGAQIVHPDDHYKFASFVEQTKRGEVYHVDGTHVRKDGSTISVKVTGSAFVYAGRPALLAVLRDVTGELQAIDALKRNETLLQFTLEATQIGQWELDLATDQATRSVRHDQIFGYDGLQPNWSYDLFLNTHVHPDDRGAVDGLLQQALEGRAVWEFECRIVRVDGQQRWIWVTSSIARTEEGQPRQLVGLVMDITARKEIELRELENEQRFRTLVEQIQDYAIFMTDRAGRPTSWNEGVRRVLGFAEEEFLFQDLTDRIYTAGDRRAGVPQAELAEASRAGTAASERWMCKADGSEFFALGVTTCLLGPDQQPLGYMKVLRDQTERKHMEDELRSIASSLAAADRRKDEFLAMLAHELRNPLAPIRSGLDLLALEDLSGNRDVVRLMQDQVEHVVRLVDDLLDVSRIMRGKVDLRTQPVELTPLIHRTIEAVQHAIQMHDHTLHLELSDEPIWIQADPVRIVQVLENLVSNACKYMEAGGRIELSTRLRDGEVVIKVCDQGLGIEPELLAGVFELFTQSSRSLDRSQGGLGIGLTLVKRLVELHGGTVSAESEGMGRGSTFTVRLPTTTPLAYDQPKVAVSSNHQPRSIVIVDDNEGAAWLLSKLLRKLGDHQIRTAHDGPSALQLVLDTHPELVFLDIGLPGMDGYEVSKAIRSRPEFDDVLLVALTGYGQAEDRLKSQRAGIDEHSVKPPSIDQVRTMLMHPKLNGK